MTLKDDLITLQTDPTFAGANPATTFKIPGVNTIPGEGGVAVVNVGAQTITITTADLTYTLEDWDFTDWSVIIPDNSYIGKIRNCLFGGDNSRGFTAYINGGGTQESKGGVQTIERCTFDGGSTLNPASFIHCRFEIIQNNKMMNASDDYMKPSGWDSSTISYIQGNFLDEPVVTPNDTLAYNAATSYSVGDGIIMTVSKSGATAKPFLAIALNSGILGAPPTTWATNTDWQFIDPHNDFMQADGKLVGPIVVRWNTMLMKASLRNIGLTAGWWPQPHSTTTLAHQADAYGNRIDTRDHPSSNSSFARCFASPPASWIGTKPKFWGNWLETDYNYINSGGGAFDWGGNTKFDETLIPFNDPNVSGPGAVDYAAPARETNYPAGGIAGLSPQVGASSILDATGWNRDLVVTT